MKSIKVILMVSLVLNYGIRVLFVLRIIETFVEVQRMLQLNL
jgi:hypothetical protein